MKKLLTLSALVLALGFTACKKDKEQDPTPKPGPSNCMIKSVSGSDSSYTEYTYNDKNQTVAIKYTNGNGDTSYQTNTYNGNVVTVSDGSGANITYFLNSYGLADSMHMEFGGGLFVMDMKMSFDAQGNPTHMYLYGEAMGTEIEQTADYVYTDGNLMKSTVDDGTNTVVTTYTYYTDKENKSKASMEASSFQRFSKNLMKSSVSDDGNSNQYVYELDASGKVVKETITDQAFEQTVNHYVWGCK